MKLIIRPSLIPAMGKRSYSNSIFSVNDTLNRQPKILTPYTILVIITCFGFLCTIIFPALFIIPLVILIYLSFTYLYLNILIQKLKIKRLFEKSSRENNEFKVNYKITNFSGLKLLDYEIIDQFEGHKDYAIFFEKATPLAAGTRRRISKKLILDNGMGLKKFHKLEITIWDFIGIFEFKAIFEYPDEVMVYPYVNNLNYPWEMAQEETTRFGNYEVSKKGDSTNFLGLRNYRDGDQVKYINWAASAKHGKVLINEFEKLVDAKTTIFLNNDFTTHMGSGLYATFEYIRDLALTIAQNQLDRGNQLQLCTLDGPLQQGLGGDFFCFLEKKIASLDFVNKDKVKIQGLEEKFFHLVSKESTLFYLTPMHYADYLERDLAILKQLASDHRQIIVVFFDAIDSLINNVTTEFKSDLVGLKERNKASLQEKIADLKSYNIFAYQFKIAEEKKFEAELLKFARAHQTYRENFYAR